MASIFTKIINREIPAHILAESKEYIAFLDVFPCAVGHTLVIPKVEVDYLFDLDVKAYAGLMEFVKKLEPALRKAIPCKRIGMAVVGLEVPHAHVHLIPMNSMRDMNFSNKIKQSQEELSQTAEKIRAFVEAK